MAPICISRYVYTHVDPMRTVHAPYRLISSSADKCWSLTNVLFYTAPLVSSPQVSSPKQAAGMRPAWTSDIIPGTASNVILGFACERQARNACSNQEGRQAAAAVRACTVKELVHSATMLGLAAVVIVSSYCDVDDADEGLVPSTKVPSTKVSPDGGDAARVIYEIFYKRTPYPIIGIE